MPPKRFRTLGWRILLWMSLVALGPLVIMAYQGYHCARQAIVESQEKHLRSVLESRKTRIETWLREIKEDFRFLASAPCVQKDCAGPFVEAGTDQEREFLSLLDHVRKSSPSYETIDAYDLNWKRLIRTTSPDRHDQDLFPPDFISKLQGADGIVLTPANPHEDGGLDLHVGHPVLNSGGDKVGYVVANLDLSPTLDPILSDRSGLGETGKVHLLSSEGRCLKTWMYSFDPSDSKSHLPPEVLSAGSQKVFDYTDQQGIKVLGASTAIPDLSWVIVTEVDQEEAFVWLGRLRKRALITGTVTLVIVLILAVRGAGRLSKPLRKLAAVSGRIAQGRHEVRLGRLEGTEAREVGRAFNAMLDELAASHQRLMHAASLAAVGELSSSIVHEMRNPLSSVKMNLQALRRRVEGDDAHSELADIAFNQVMRLETMLSDLLGYGKPLQLNLAAIRLGDIAGEVAEVVGKDVTERGVSVDIEDELGQTMVMADPEQVRRALTNLVANAVQASSQGGRVVIELKIAPNDSNRIIVSVSDEGRGISDTHMAQLFQPFFTTRDGGTGLGLANVKKIVDYHGGEVSADNRSERGAIFTMIMPMGGPPA